MSGHAGHVLARGGHRLAELGLATAIFAGSLVLWIGIPAGWLWLVTRLTAEYPNAWAAATFGAPLTMIAWGYLLARLNGVYLRMSGAAPAQQRTAWLKSLSGDRARRPPRGVLDVSMTVSVVLAVLTLLVWFFFFAENYSPGRVL